MWNTSSKSLVIAAALMLGGAIGASADSCFQDSNGLVFVAKGSSIPGKGTCKSVKGYFSQSNEILSGAACGTSDGSAIRFNLNYADAFSGTLGVYAFSVSRTSLTGTGYIYSASSQSATGFQVSTVACPAVSFD